VIGASRTSRIAHAVWAALIMLFLFFPIAIIILYAFNPSNVQSWPLDGLSTKWFASTFHNQDMRDAFWLSIRAALIATCIALLLGSMAAFAVHRFRFFGRETVSLVLVLPIALPGIITGMALNSFFTFNHINLSLWTIVVGHATFCVVIVYNNVLARLRRSSPSLLEASMDLGADGWQTFRFVVWPVLSTALVAGGLLAFALSFDEVIVTTFTAGAQTTLPIYILDHIQRGQDLPVVNAIVFVVIVVTVIPVTIAQRLTGDAGVIRRSTATTAAGAAAGGGAV
jgi:putative spermidine/putrescine transport system permease protein